MNIPNISGIRILNKPQSMPDRLGSGVAGIKNLQIAPKTNLMKETSDFGEEVDMLTNSYNNRAFLYNSGKVDIVKGGHIKTVKFKTKKHASLYMMKVGWKYV